MSRQVFSHQLLAIIECMQQFRDDFLTTTNILQKVSISTNKHRSSMFGCVLLDYGQLHRPWRRLGVSLSRSGFNHFSEESFLSAFNFCPGSIKQTRSYPSYSLRLQCCHCPRFFLLSRFVISTVWNERALRINGIKSKITFN